MTAETYHPTKKDVRDLLVTARFYLREAETSMHNDEVAALAFTTRAHEAVALMAHAIAARTGVDVP